MSRSHLSYRLRTVGSGGARPGGRHPTERGGMWGGAAVRDSEPPVPSRVSDVRRLVAHFTGPSAPSSLRAGNRAKRETRHSFIRSLRRFLAHGVSLSSCLSLATVSQSHSSAVGKGPASSPHSLHCVSVPRYTPPADRDRDRPASSFLSWTAGPSPGAPPPSAPLTPFTRRRLAAGVMRGVRNGPSFFRPITALRRPCRRNRAKEVTAFHSFPPSLRSGVSLPFPLRPYATPFVHFGHSVSSLVMLSPPFGPGRNRDDRRWSGRTEWGGGGVRPQARSLATHSLLPSPAPFPTTHHPFTRRSGAVGEVKGGWVVWKGCRY